MEMFYSDNSYEFYLTKHCEIIRRVAEQTGYMRYMEKISYKEWIAYGRGLKTLGLESFEDWYMKNFPQ